MAKKKLSLHWKILIGMGAGILVGLGASMMGLGWLISDWIAPFGTIFINLLKLMAVPLVFASLIKGITSLDDIGDLSSLGGKTFVIYIATTVIAVTLGLVLVNLAKPGDNFPSEIREQLSSQFEAKASNKIALANQVKEEGPLEPLVKIVPDNIFSSMSSNGNILQVIVFAILFGAALLTIDKSIAKPVKDFFGGVNDILINMILIIMKTAPYGVFGLMASLIADLAGDDLGVAFSLLGTLSYYALVVLVGLALMAYGVYPLILKVVTKQKYRGFFKGISPAQLMAFSTSSSAATLPVTMECVEENLGVRKQISSFVLPLGATVNMDGTSLYLGIATVFIAQAYGIDLSLTEQLSIVVTATLASIGAAAVPSVGLVMLVIILEQSKIPIEGVTLVFATDRILDMCRTVVNVTGDAMVCKVMQKLSKE